MSIRYPIYIISKSRYNNPITINTLKKMGMTDYKIFVEEEQYENYRNNEHIEESNIIKMPFSNLGKGSIPARNYVWDYSIQNGDKKHWILDDNIEDFKRINRGERILVRSDATFRACEDFTDRFENVALSGMNYDNFVRLDKKFPPFYYNTRIYSCILIRNDIPYRWRGKYNEDTDLSLRVLKDGWCTLLINAFSCGKLSTQKIDGGNTNDLYEQTNDRYEFSEALYKQHPDIVKITRKFNRFHHHINYKIFKNNKPKLKEEFKNIPNKINNYGMKIICEDQYDYPRNV